MDISLDLGRDGPFYILQRRKLRKVKSLNQSNTGSSRARTQAHICLTQRVWPLILVLQPVALVSQGLCQVGVVTRSFQGETGHWALGRWGLCPRTIVHPPLFLPCLSSPFLGPSSSASETLVITPGNGLFSSLRRYLANSLANLFAGAWEPQPEGPLPLDIPQASPQQVTYLCSLARDPPPPPTTQLPPHAEWLLSESVSGLSSWGASW